MIYYWVDRFAVLILTFIESIFIFLDSNVVIYKKRTDGINHHLSDYMHEATLRYNREITVIKWSTELNQTHALEIILRQLL